MSIADKITQLTTIRASMREKLVAKGVDASTHNFADFPNDVESIPSGGTPIATMLNKRIKVGDYYAEFQKRSYSHFTLTNSSGVKIVTNFNGATSWRICVKFNAYVSDTNYRFIVASAADAQGTPCVWFNNGRFGGQVSSNGSSWTSTAAVSGLSTNTVYYGVHSFKNGTQKISVYDESGSLIGSDTQTGASQTGNSSQGLDFGGGYGNYNFQFDGLIYPDECFVEIGGTLIWGQTNSKTQNMGLED